MTSSFPLGSYVWCKQEGSPWWPGVLIDPVAADLTAPEGLGDQVVCVLCLPTSQSSAVFVHADNPQEIQHFDPSAEAHEQLVRESMSDPTCAEAVVEAQAAVSAGTAAPAAKSSALKNEGGEDDHRHSSKHRKRRHHERERSEKKKQRHDDEEQDRLLFDDDELEATARRRSRGKSERRSSQKDRSPSRKRHRGPPESDENAAADRLHTMEQEDPTELYVQRFGSDRHPATDNELQRYKEDIMTCLEPLHNEEGAVVEESLLAVLRQLAVCEVTLEQLQELGIGVIVGGLLKDVFPVRVRVLAKAILSYWFVSLEGEVQKELLNTNDPDNWSSSAVRDESEDRGLGGEALIQKMSALAVQIFSLFTEEEIMEANVSDQDALELCTRMESVLLSNPQPDIRMAALHRVGSESSLRLNLLTGQQTPEDIVAREERVLEGAGSPVGLRSASPYSPFVESSPTSFEHNTMSQIDVPTTMYACHNCGAQDAYRIGYSVSAHDNYPVILHCRRCNETWNMAS